MHEVDYKRITVQKRVARTYHNCRYCGRTIAPGSTYSREVDMVDGQVTATICCEPGGWCAIYGPREDGEHAQER